MPRTLRFPDGNETHMEWTTATVLNRGGEFAQALKSPPIPLESGSDLAYHYLLDPADLSLVGIEWRETLEVRLDPFEIDGIRFILPTGAPGAAFQILNAQPAIGGHTFISAGQPVNVTVEDGSITYFIEFRTNSRPTLPDKQYGIRLERHGSEVLVFTGFRLPLQNEQAPWKHSMTWTDFEPMARGGASAFHPVQPVGDFAAFDRLPPTSRFSVYPLEPALERAKEQNVDVRAFLADPEWYARYAQLMTTSGVVGPTGVLAEAMEWNVDLVAPAGALRVTMNAPIVNGQAFLERQQTTVEPTEAPYEPEARDALVYLDQVHALCNRLLPVYGGAASIEFHDATNVPYSGPQRDSNWIPWYGCGPNIPNNRVVQVEARTGLLRSYFAGVVNYPMEPLVPTPTLPIHP